MPRLQKPKKQNTPAPSGATRHPMALPGMRWIPSIALSPANLLQLQQHAGNQAVTQLLQKFASPEHGRLDALKTYRAARKDGITPPPGVDSQLLMQQQDPHFGDWHFQFVADQRTGSTAMVWITLNQYKNRQRHILIDAETNTPHDLLGGDLDEQDRQLLMDWGVQMLKEQLTGNLPPAAAASGQSSSPMEEEEELLDTLLTDSGDDDGGGAGIGAAIAAAATARKGGGKPAGPKG